jgi:DNA-binding response OmpR family regulator
VDEKAHILVVEDDPFSRDILSRRLQGMGFAVSEAANGAAADEHLQNASQFDIALLDINLPDTTGLEILKGIRQARSRNQLPVIMISALSESEVVIEGLELGANDYVTKPIEMAILAARVEGCLQLKRNFQALLDAERQRVMIESMGAACHHIAQPLTIAFTSLELHLSNLEGASEETLQDLQQALASIKKASEIMHRMQDLSEYRTIPYVSDKRIIDLGINPFPADPECRAAAI